MIEYAAGFIDRSCSITETSISMVQGQVEGLAAIHAHWPEGKLRKYESQWTLKYSGKHAIRLLVDVYPHLRVRKELVATYLIHFNITRAMLDALDQR